MTFPVTETVTQLFVKKLDSDLQTYLSLEVTGVWISNPQDCNLSIAFGAIPAHPGNSGSPEMVQIWIPVGTAEVSKGNREKNIFQAELHATLITVPAMEVHPCARCFYSSKQLCTMGIIILLLPMK